MSAAETPVNASRLILFPNVDGLHRALEGYLIDMRIAVRKALEELDRQIDPSREGPAGGEDSGFPEGSAFPTHYVDRLNYLRAWLKAEWSAHSAIADMAAMEAMKLRRSNGRGTKPELTRARFDRRTLRFHSNGNLSVSCCGETITVLGGATEIEVGPGKPAGYLVRLPMAWALDVAPGRAAAKPKVPIVNAPASPDLQWSADERTWFDSLPVQDQTLIAARLANADDHYRKLLKLKGGERRRLWTMADKEIDKAIQLLMRHRAPDAVKDRLHQQRPKSRCEQDAREKERAHV